MVKEGRLNAARKRTRKNVEDDERNARLRAEQHSRELIPGIPHDITTQEICKWLPWRTLHEQLWKVNFAWKDVIQGREIYEARVRSGSTDSLIVFNHSILPNRTFGIAVLSLRDRSIVQLPPIPRIKKGIPESCQCLTLDGRIYILGGLKKPRAQVASEDVYMMDLAGHGPWKKCASMRAPRCNFGSSVFNGKLYVFGGSSSRAPVRETEVYDPNTDSWTTIKPMNSSRTSHKVGKCGSWLMIFGGSHFRPDFLQLQINHNDRQPTLTEVWYTQPARYIELYNPIKDEWKRGKVDTNTYNPFERSFVFKGVLHAMGPSGISAYHVSQNSWVHMQPVATSIIDGSGAYTRCFWPLAILVVDGELVVIESMCPIDGSGRSGPISMVLNQSIGFGFRGRELKWKRIECPLQFHDMQHTCTFIRPIRL